ncbi:hypothetical protein [Paraburkholderia sp.]|uniref:hypothetical protein n=1 Tax=Paraburkholderia sp. TaxID=1926495 RepID=UPI0039E570B7
MSTVVTSAPVFVKATFNGNTGAGSISVPGLQVGDIGVFDFNGHNVIGSSFEQVVSIADEIQQISGADLSGQTYELFFVRWQ